MKMPRASYFYFLKPFFFSIVAMVLVISLSIYILGWYHLSRFIVYGSIGLFFILEMIYLFLRIFFWKKLKIKELPFTLVFFIAEMAMIIITFFSLYFYRKGHVSLRDDYLVLLMGIFFAWLMFSFLIHRFLIEVKDNYIKTLGRFWTSELLTIGSVAFFIFTLNLAEFSRFIILGSLSIFAVFENFVVTIYYLIKRGRKTDEVEIDYFKAPLVEYHPLDIEEPIKKRVRERYDVPGVKHPANYVREQLKKLYLSKFPEVFKFLDSNINLKGIDIMRSMVIFTANPYNIEIIKDNYLLFFLNLQEMNNHRRINKYLIEVNRKMKKGSVAVGRFQSLVQSRERIYDKYPFVVARTMQFLQFLFKRVMPKLPILKSIYFAFTKGKKRIISKAEALGRIYFCGFKVVALAEIGFFTWFIAAKVGKPQGDKNPSYGPLFKQKRVGKGKKIFYMYKMRTMHPYSEYIHQYIYDHHHLDDTGKIKDDFRITGWGRVFRRVWLDEWPMIINWLKGHVKLVGVRPLSETFFATYPNDLKKDRILQKPGLIPPYYVDMPDSIEEVWESERKYLQKYQKRPFRTDFVYFFKALNNILFRHAKSS
jgi:lipopolysaccharide/colanic/teichoic acid biosynthesis glycosyltransferase